MEELEIWKDIPGYEGLYQASTLGRIKSFKFNKIQGNILVINFEKNGYGKICLYKELKRKKYWIHRIIATTFLHKTVLKTDVNHKDGNPKNNSVLNLEWCTKSENSIHCWRVLKRKHGSLGKINMGGVKIVQKKDNLIIKIWDSIKDINREYGFSSGNICECCKGKYNGKMYGYEWKYYNPTDAEQLLYYDSQINYGNSTT